MSQDVAVHRWRQKSQNWAAAFCLGLANIDVGADFAISLDGAHAADTSIDSTSASSLQRSKPLLERLVETTIVNEYTAVRQQMRTRA